MEKLEKLDLVAKSSVTNHEISRRDFLKKAFITSICLAGNGMIASVLKGCADEESFKKELSLEELLPLDPYMHFNPEKELPRLHYRNEYYENVILDTAEPIDMDEAKPLLKRLFEKELEIAPNGLPIENLIDCTMNDEGTSFKLKELSQTEFFEIIKQSRGNEDFTVEIISPDEISITITPEDSESFENIIIKNGNGSPELNDKNAMFHDTKMVITKKTPYGKRTLGVSQKERSQISTFTSISTLKTNTENSEGTNELEYEPEQNMTAIITSNGYLVLFQQNKISISKENDPIFTQINDLKTLMEYIATFKKYETLTNRIVGNDNVKKIVVDMIKSIKNLNELKTLMENFDGNYNMLISTTMIPFYKRLNDDEIISPILRYIITSLDKFIELIQIIPKNPDIFSGIMKACGPQYRAWDNDRSSSNIDEYRDPISTFKSGWADCDDFAVINYSWAYANGYNPQFKIITQNLTHVFVWYIDEKNRTVVLDNNDATIMNEGLTIENYISMHPLISDEDWEEFLKTENKEPLAELDE